MKALHQPRKGLPFIVFLVLACATLVSAPGLASTLSVSSLAEPEEAETEEQAPVDPNVVQPFVLQTSDVAERKQAIHCLAEAIYYEAAFEPLDGQRGVAQVIINRMRDRNFPDSVCGVVYQGWQRKTGCQFSFVCDGSLKRRPPTQAQLYFAGLVAEQALTGYVEQTVDTATHYHTDYVDPYWAPTLVEITKVGTHIFYKWPGKAGAPTALTEEYAGGEVRFWRTAAARLPRAKV